MTRCFPRGLPLLVVLAGCSPPSQAPSPSPSVDAGPCRSANGQLRDTLYFPGPGIAVVAADSVLDRGPAAEYAKGRHWFDSDRPIQYGSKTYIRFGLTRWFTGVQRTTGDSLRIVRIGSYDGVPIFSELDADTNAPAYFLVLAKRGCEFQPYHDVSKIHINYGPPPVVENPVPAYTAVLEHIRAVEKSYAAYPIVLKTEIRDKRGSRDEPSAPVHSASVVAKLTAHGLVVGTCQAEEVQRCVRDKPTLLVHLSEVHELEGTRVKIPRGERAPGQSLKAQVDAIPDSVEVRFDLDVDVDLTILCPSTARPSSCRAGGREYMYFLRKEPNGKAVVVGRWVLD